MQKLMRTTRPAGDEVERSGRASGPPKWLVPAALVAFIAGVVVLSWQKPLTADDYCGLVVLRLHPTLWAYLVYWYTTWIGRMTGVALWWVALKAPVPFALANGLAFASLPVLVFTLATARAPRSRQADWAVLGTLTAAFWFALPILAQTVFWTSGAVTYLWSSVFMLALMCPYRMWLSTGHESGEVSSAHGWVEILKIGGMFLLGVVTGAAHEQVLVGVAVLAVAFILRVVREHALARIPARLWAGAAGFAAGAAVLLSSPGNAARASVVPQIPIGMAAYLRAVATYLSRILLTSLTPSYAWLLALLLLGLAGGTASSVTRRGGMWSASAWLLAAAASVGVFVVQPRILLLGSERTLMFAVVLLAVAALSVGGDSWRVADQIGEARAGTGEWATAVTVTVLLLIALIDAVTGVRLSRAISARVAARDRIVAAQVRAGQLDVVVPPLGIEGSRVVLYSDIQQDPKNYINVAVANTYGVRTIRLGDAPRP